MEKSKFEYTTIPAPEGLTDLIKPLREEALKKSLERGLLTDTAVCLVLPPQQASDPAQLSFGVLVGIDVKFGPEGEVWPFGTVLKNVASAGVHCYETFHIDLIFPGASYDQAWQFAHRLLGEFEQKEEQAECADVP